jgi:hypothetical protein
MHHVPGHSTAIVLYACPEFSSRFLRWFRINRPLPDFIVHVRIGIIMPVVSF